MQSTNERRYVDRSNWPSGPWDDEPDAVSWVSAVGLPCEMRRNRKGEWCGYVGASPEHPSWTYAQWDLWVHGDINFSAPSENFRPEMAFPAGLHWRGFDCGHLNDITPRDAYEPANKRALYRDVAYVRAECESLAHQIDAAALLAEAGYGGPRHLRGDAWSAPDWAVRLARRFGIPRAVRLQELRCLARNPAVGERVWKDGVSYSSIEELFAKSERAKTSEHEPDAGSISPEQTDGPGYEWIRAARSFLDDVTPRGGTRSRLQLRIARALKEQYDHGRTKGWGDAINRLQEKSYE